MEINLALKFHLNKRHCLLIEEVNSITMIIVNFKFGFLHLVMCFLSSNFSLLLPEYFFFFHLSYVGSDVVWKLYVMGVGISEVLGQGVGISGLLFPGFVT
jgi:hypothetical protein